MLEDECDVCHRRFRSLAMHRSKSAKCKPVKQKALPAQYDDSLSKIHDTNVLRERAAAMLQHLRYDKEAAESLIDELKPALAEIRCAEINVLRQRIQPLLQPGMEMELEDVLKSISDPSYGFKTAKHERDYAINQQKFTVLEPRVRNLRQPGAKIDYKDVKNHGSVGISIIESLARLMQEDHEICSHIIAASDEWKTGELHGVPAALLGDMCDGENFRNHEITRKADESEVDTVRCGLQLYNDGVTVSALPFQNALPDLAEPHHSPSARPRLWCRFQMCCPIGFAKSEQKYECCYASIVNLPPRLRFSQHAIQLLELTNSKAFKSYGAARVLSGVNSNGEQVDDDCFAADMRKLQQGVKVEIPKSDGGTRTIVLQAWVIGLSADFPAAGALLPFMESTSAHVWCRECEQNFQERDPLGRPFACLGGCNCTAKRPRSGSTAPKAACTYRAASCARLRDTRAMRLELVRLRALRRSGTNVSKEMQAVSHSRSNPPDAH